MNRSLPALTRPCRQGAALWIGQGSPAGHGQAGLWRLRGRAERIHRAIDLGVPDFRAPRILPAPKTAHASQSVVTHSVAPSGASIRIRLGPAHSALRHQRRTAPITPIVSIHLIAQSDHLMPQSDPLQHPQRT
jgi:hypothetical protein